MRLIDADAAIKDAELNYGGACDVELVKYFIEKQPTINMERKIEWKDIVDKLKGRMDVCNYSFFANENMIIGTVKDRYIDLWVANEFIKSMVIDEKIMMLVEQAYYELTGRSCAIAYRVGDKDKINSYYNIKQKYGCEACNNKYCITCVYQTVDEWSEPCISCSSEHRKYKPTNYCCECGKRLIGE